jgi:hypothetical protein
LTGWRTCVCVCVCVPCGRGQVPDVVTSPPKARAPDTRRSSINLGENKKNLLSCRTRLLSNEAWNARPLGSIKQGGLLLVVVVVVGCGRRIRTTHRILRRAIEQQSDRASEPARPSLKPDEAQNSKSTTTTQERGGMDAPQRASCHGPRGRQPALRLAMIPDVEWASCSCARRHVAALFFILQFEVCFEMAALTP